MEVEAHQRCMDHMSTIAPGAASAVSRGHRSLHLRRMTFFDRKNNFGNGKIFLIDSNKNDGFHRAVRLLSYVFADDGGTHIVMCSMLMVMCLRCLEYFRRRLKYFFLRIIFENNFPCIRQNLFTVVEWTRSTMYESTRIPQVTEMLPLVVRLFHCSLR